MSAHNIQFHDKRRKILSIFVFMSYRKDFVGTQERVRISHGKRTISVQAIEVRLYIRHLLESIFFMSGTLHSRSTFAIF